MTRARPSRKAAGVILLVALGLAGAACGENGGVIEGPARSVATSTTTTVFVDPDARQGVTPGAFCSPEGAKGQTATGLVMTCTKQGDERARWRSA